MHVQIVQLYLTAIANVTQSIQQSIFISLDHHHRFHGIVIKLRRNISQLISDDTKQ